METPADPIPILVVEDDDALRNTIVEFLAEAGYSPAYAANGKQAEERIEATEYPVILLDIGLPLVDGWTILERHAGNLLPAIIVISARGSEQDKVRALDLGADDYLTKPFGAKELLARIRAVLRRVERESDERTNVTVGEVSIDLTTKTVKKNGVEVRLSPTEWVLLAELAEHAGTTLEQTYLLRKVWGPQYVGDRNYLRTFILRLRRKIEEDPAVPTVIETIGKLGYRLGKAPER